MEGFKEYQLPLTVSFVYFKKAFDSINRKINYVLSTVTLRHPRNYSECHTGSLQQFQQCCNSGWKHLRSLWCNNRSSSGWCFGSLPLYYSCWLPFRYSCKASGPDSGVVTCPRQSRRYHTKMLNDLDFADDIALLESSMSRTQSQLTRTADATADLGLVISVPKTAFMTVIHSLHCKYMEPP